MAAKKRDALRTQLRAELMTDPSGKIWSNTQLNDFLAQAYRKIQSDTQFGMEENESATDSFSTVDGTAEYDLPTNFGRMEAVNISSQPLTLTTLKKIKQRNPGTVTGSPTEYYIRGTKIGLHPTPIEAKTVEELFISAFVFPVNDTTVIDYDDDEIERALIKYGAYLAWSSPRGNRATALEKREDYNEVMGSIKLRKLFRDRNIDYKTVRRSRHNYNPRALGGGFH